MNVLEFVREMELTSNYALAILHIVSASVSDNPSSWIDMAVDDLKAEKDFIANEPQRSQDKFIKLCNEIEKQFKDRGESDVLKENQ